MNPSSENPAHARATNESPLSESISIVIAGIRNAGKSSLLNTLFEKEVAIVSPVAGAIITKTTNFIAKIRKSFSAGQSRAIRIYLPMPRSSAYWRLANEAQSN